MATESQHPTPWRVQPRRLDTQRYFKVQDARGNHVADFDGEELAARIVTAVNEKAERDAGPAPGAHEDER